MNNVAKIVGWVVGVLLVAAYITVLVLQYCYVDASPEEWNRRLQLLNPLEALAFAGAGVLLGTVVQKQATRDAQARADENEEAAEKAKAVESVVKAKAEGPTPSHDVKEIAAVLEQASR